MGIKRDRTSRDFVRQTSLQKNKPKRPRLATDVAGDSHHGDKFEAMSTDFRSICKTISHLVEQVQEDELADAIRTSAMVSLCRMFSQAASLRKSQRSHLGNENAQLLLMWLNQKYSEFTALLLSTLNSPVLEKGLLVIDLSMQLVKEETNSFLKANQSPWTEGLFVQLLQALLGGATSPQLVDHFLVTYVRPFTDVKYFTLSALKSVARLARMGFANLCLGQIA